MSIDNVIASGLGVRDDSSSQTSKVRREDGPVRVGLVRKIRNVTTLATAQAIRLTDADSGTLFCLTMSGNGVLTFTLAPGVSDGATFEFVVVAVGGTGDVDINAGTNAALVARQYRGIKKSNGGPTTVGAGTIARFDISFTGSIGDSIHVTKIADLLVHVDAEGDALDSVTVV